MDLYNNEINQIKMYGNMRYDAARAHNERVDARRRQAAQQILQAKQGEQRTVAEENIEESASAAGAGVSTAIDANGARSALKNHLEKKGKIAVKNQVKSSVESVAKKIEGASKTALDQRTLNPLVDSAEEGEKMSRRVAASGLKGKIGNKMDAAIASKIGKTGLKSAGSLMNVFMAGDALHDDFKGGQFHIAGKNGLEQASNVLQIGSGVADIVGLEFPPALAVGMLLGAASSVTGAVGKEQELEKTEAKQSSQLKATTSKIQSSIADLKTINPEAARAAAIASIPKPKRPTFTSSSAATAKVAG